MLQDGCKIYCIFILFNNFLDKCRFDIYFLFVLKVSIYFVCLFRYIIFVLSSYNKYVGELFFGIYDVMFDIENKVDFFLVWVEVKKYIFIVVFIIQVVAGILINVLQKGFCRVVLLMEKYCVVFEREIDGEWVLIKWIFC